MSTAPIPIFTPQGGGNLNPSGQNFLPFAPMGSGGPGNMNFGNTMNPNPTGTGSSPTPIFQPQSTSTPSSVGGFPSPINSPTKGSNAIPSGGNPFGQSGNQQWWTQDYLEKAFGGGMGSLIYQYLMSGGGLNTGITQNTIDAQTNAMQRQQAQGANDLTSRLGAMGITGGSSSLPQALTDYENQATQTQQALTASEYYNMWQQAQQNELNMIQFGAEGTGKYLANKPNWMDYVGQGLGFIGDAVGIAGGIKSLSKG